MKTLPCNISAKAGGMRRNNSCFLHPFAKPNAKEAICSALYSVYTPSRQANPELDGGQSSRAAFHSTTQQSCERSPAPHLILAYGQESCLSHLAHVAHQSAYHSSARSSLALSGDGHSLFLEASLVSQESALPVHDPSCPKRLRWHFPGLCRLGSQPQPGVHIALLRRAGPAVAARAHLEAGTSICSLHPPTTCSPFPLTDRQGISDGDHFY